MSRTGNKRACVNVGLWLGIWGVTFLWWPWQTGSATYWSLVVTFTHGRHSSTHPPRPRGSNDNRQDPPNSTTNQLAGQPALIRERGTGYWSSLTKNPLQCPVLFAQTRNQSWRSYLTGDCWFGKHIKMSQGILGLAKRVSWRECVVWVECCQVWPSECRGWRGKVAVFSDRCTV